ncbi:MAG: hypothetical protein Kilf2KO_44570 [Rhodospirillales bacterium]
MADEALEQQARDEALRDLLRRHGGRLLIAQWLRRLNLNQDPPSADLERYAGRREGALFIWGECQRVDPKMAGRLVCEEIENGRRF